MMNFSYLLTTVIDWQSVIFGLLGGLAIFLFSINYMGEGLQLLAGSNMKRLIEKSTNNPFKGILLGIVVTGLIQSSSGTTAIVVALITAGLMTVRQSLGIIMGANIGTTVTSFLIGMKIEDYRFPIIFLGALLLIFFNKKKIIYLGQVILGFGLLFLGLKIMSDQLKVLQNFDPFLDALKTFTSNVPMSVLVGSIFTAIVQSSSAAIGIIQNMYAENIFPFKTAVALVMGANIGTTITAALASLGGNRASKQTALAHFLFNVIGTVLFVIFIVPFTNLMFDLFGNQSPKLQLAWTHGVFNIAVVIMFLPFLGLLEKVLNFVIKPVDNDLNTDILTTKSLAIPSVALVQAKKALEYAAKLTIKSSEDAYAFFQTKDSAKKEHLMNVEKEIDTIHVQLVDYLQKLTDHQLTPQESELHGIIFQAIKEVESIGDNYRVIATLIEDIKKYDINYSDLATQDLERMFKYSSMMLQRTIDYIATFKKDIGVEIMNLEEDLNKLEKVARTTHYMRLAEGLCSSNSSAIYIDLLSNLERVGDHCANVVHHISHPKVEDIAIDINRIDSLLK